MHHHHLLSNITGSQSGRSNGSATGAACFAPSAFHNSLTADIFNGSNVANQIHLNYSLSNSLNSNSNNNNNNNSSASLHQTLLHNGNNNNSNNNSNSKNQHTHHHLGQRAGRHQYLPAPGAPATLSAINAAPQFTNQPHSLRNSTPTNGIKSNHSFHVRNQAANDNHHHHHHHHHHHLGTFSNHSSANSSSSSSPSASISPTSLAPSLASLQHNGIMGVSNGLATNLHNNHHQLTIANNLQQQTNNGNSNSQQQQQQQNTSRYKTELCRPFEENGTCKYGEKCQFAHGVNELRTLTRHPKYKTEFCRTFHTTGFCPYGPRCHFIHNGKAPAGANSMPLSGYTNSSFAQQGSHSISPSSSPISSASTATTANGSVSSASSTVSSSSGSPPSPTIRSLDLTLASGNRSFELNGQAMEHRYIDSYKSLLADSTSFADNQSLRKNAAHFNATIKSPRSTVTSSVSPVSSSSLRNDSEDGSSSPNNSSSYSSSSSSSNGCATKTQRLFWLHFHMNESSQCAGELTGGAAGRTWKAQA